MSNYGEGSGDSFVIDVISCQCLMCCNFGFCYYFPVQVLCIFFF